MRVCKRVFSVGFGHGLVSSVSSVYSPFSDRVGLPIITIPFQGC